MEEMEKWERMEVPSFFSELDYKTSSLANFLIPVIFIFSYSSVLFFPHLQQLLEML